MFNQEQSQVIRAGLARAERQIKEQNDALGDRAPNKRHARFEHINERLKFHNGPTFRQLARELGVSVETIHEDIGIMRKVLGLPITLEWYPRVYYTHTPSSLYSDVFDLADNLFDYAIAA